VEPQRRELHTHCYRMLGSTHDADDALQDALLRAWRGVSRFEGRSSLRSWLYTVVPSVSQQQTLRQIDDARLREIVADYSAALERGDALVALLTEDVTWSMPPLPHWYHGLGAVTDFAVQVPLTGCGSWRHIPTSANGQPALGCYLWDDDVGAHLGWSITVMTLRGEQIAELTTFIGRDHLAPFGLPDSLP
jgi:RNA polymerase sigma-70 factor (ECF subfamily)